MSRVENFDSARLCRVATQVAVVHKSVQMRMHRRGRTEPNSLADFTNCWGIPTLAHALTDVAENLLLSISELLALHMGSLQLLLETVARTRRETKHMFDLTYEQMFDTFVLVANTCSRHGVCRRHLRGSRSCHTRSIH